MYDKKELEAIKNKKIEWEKNFYKKLTNIHPERKESFENLSGIKINNIYYPYNNKNLDFIKDIGFPGEYPFLRGIHSTMYRGRLWTMRQFAGFGSAEETNKRYNMSVFAVNSIFKKKGIITKNTTPTNADLVTNLLNSLYEK